jgi:hypothetical protein
VEWTGGPHAIEVIGELETLADDEVTIDGRRHRR